MKYNHFKYIAMQFYFRCIKKLHRSIKLYNYIMQKVYLIDDINDLLEKPPEKEDVYGLLKDNWNGIN